jgi:hypothetical protein
MELNDMSTQIYATFEAAGTITEYAAVLLDAANKIIVTTNGSDPSIIGIAQSAAVSGDLVNVVVSGKTRMVAGAAVVPATNNQLMTTANGRIIVATSTNFVTASAIPSSQDAAYAAGEQFIGIFQPPQVVKA